MTTFFLGLFTLSPERFCCWNLQITWDLGCEVWWNGFNWWHFIHRFITLSAYAWLENRRSDILPLLQLVASWLVEPRCGQPMRKSHSTVSSNGPNQTDRNSSTKFHWTYWHRAAYLRQRVQPDWPSFESDATKLFEMSVICENFTLNFHSGIFRCTLAT